MRNVKRYSRRERTLGRPYGVAPATRTAEGRTQPRQDDAGEGGPEVTGHKHTVAKSASRSGRRKASLYECTLMCRRCSSVPTRGCRSCAVGKAMRTGALSTGKVLCAVSLVSNGKFAPNKLTALRNKRQELMPASQTMGRQAAHPGPL